MVSDIEIAKAGTIRRAGSLSGLLGDDKTGRLPLLLAAKRLKWAGLLMDSHGKVLVSKGWANL